MTLGVTNELNIVVAATGDRGGWKASRHIPGPPVKAKNRAILAADGNLPMAFDEDGRGDKRGSYDNGFGGVHELNMARTLGKAKKMRLPN